MAKLPPSLQRKLLIVLIMRDKGKDIGENGVNPTTPTAARVTTAAAPHRRLSMKTRGGRKGDVENANTVKREILAMVSKENHPQGRINDVEKTRSEVAVKIPRMHRHNPTPSHHLLMS